MRSGALIWKATYGMRRRPEQTSRKKKENKKRNLIVISCTWEIRLSPNENQESQIQKMLKKGLQ